ncbi:hypothetical protein OR1_04083 [Geobacter sp. OR-1]|nr:hypothetical protein OR1_04083 [Geobacter sp. OR-1]
MFNRDKQVEKYRRHLSAHHTCLCFWLAVNWHSVRVIDADFEDSHDELPKGCVRTVYLACTCATCNASGLVPIVFPFREAYGIGLLVNAIRYVTKTVNEEMCNCTGYVDSKRLNDIRSQLRAVWLLYHPEYGYHP